MISFCKGGLKIPILAKLGQLTRDIFRAIYADIFALCFLLKKFQFLEKKILFLLHLIS